MSQNDFTIDNQGFPALRADLNNALQALASTSSGTVAPTTTFAYQLWADTTNDLLKQRNAANTAWVDILTLSTGEPVGLGTSIQAYSAILADLVAKSGDYSLLKSGRKNIIINGAFPINQRGVTSPHTASAANEYTLDRWKIITLGQSISWTGTQDKVVTAPAGGLAQIIEGLNIRSGTYVISWTGTATCTVDAVAKTNGDTFTLTAGTNCTIIFSSGTVSDVQVELGEVATSFETRSYGEELALCQRYYERLGGEGLYRPIGQGMQNTTAANIVDVRYIEKRAEPTVTWANLFATDRRTAVNPITSLASSSAGLNGAQLNFTHSPSFGAVDNPVFVTTQTTGGFLALDAEL